MHIDVVRIESMALIINFTVIHPVRCLANVIYLHNLAKQLTIIELIVHRNILPDMKIFSGCILEEMIFVIRHADMICSDCDFVISSIRLDTYLKHMLWRLMPREMRQRHKLVAKRAYLDAFALNHFISIRLDKRHMPFI